MTINLYQFFGVPTWVQDLQTSMGLVLSNLSNLETMMSALDDELAAIKAEQANNATFAAAIKADVEKLLAAPPAGITADQQAALDAILANSKALSGTLTSIDAEANPPAPAPAPAPTPTTP